MQPRPRRCQHRKWNVLATTAEVDQAELSEEKRDIQRLLAQPYKYGFKTIIESDVFPKGLSEDVVRAISAKKLEPEWLLDFRCALAAPASNKCAVHALAPPFVKGPVGCRTAVDAWYCAGWCFGASPTHPATLAGCAGSVPTGGG